MNSEATEVLARRFRVRPPALLHAGQLAGFVRADISYFGVMSWEISGNLGRHTRTGADTQGWLWEITRGAQLAHVLIEISDAARLSDPLRLPDDTRQALETDGRTELLKVLDQNEPPRVIHCGSEGCTYSSTEEAAC